MFINEYTLTVDIKKRTQAIVPKFVQYDNASLIFKVLNNGKPYNLTAFTRAEIAHKRPDGQVVVGTGTLETLVSGERVVRYNYLGSEMHNVGFVETSLSIFSEDKKVTTQPFKVEITTDNRDGLVENSKEEVGLLQELITNVSAILDDANTAIDNANNAVTIANQATTDANTAITNANSAVTEAQDAANATIQVKDDTLVVKAEAEQAAINANNAVTNLVHKGEYNPIASYLARNIVSFDGSSYINIIPSTGISPTDNTHWKLIGKKGDTGLQGIQGVKGDKGDKGDTGKGFSIAKTYPSVAVMYADYNNASIPIGSFVLINTSDINNVENAMLFVKTEIEYSYLTDLSGAQGIQGERGLQGIQGTQGIQGAKGDKGDKGDSGIDGLSITWRGNYNSIDSYNSNDAVYYEGSSYLALKPLTGITPTNDGINWSMMAQRGVDGTGSVSTVNTKLPDMNGNVTLTPSDIGASPSDHTHSELHTHTNKTVLDKFTESNGNPQYNGSPIGAVTSVNNQVGDVTGLETTANSDTKLATKVDKVTGKGLSTEDFTTAEKTKLNGVENNANNYTHPATHPPSIIVQDASNRFMTDAEKTKLSGIATNANNYTHPANHPASIITQDASNRFVTDTEKNTWNAKASTSLATTSANGLMASTDKTLLNVLDTKTGDISQLHTLDKSNLVNAMNELNSDVAGVAIGINDLETDTSNKIGILTDLKTTNKANLVGAVNEQLTETKERFKHIWVDVKKDFNAKGDGIAEDTLAIQNAMNAVSSEGGGIVYVPKGSYLVNRINVPLNVSLIGSGKFTTKFIAYGSLVDYSPLFYFLNHSNIEVCNFSIEVNKTTFPLITTMHFENMVDSYVHDIVISEAGAIGVFTFNSKNTIFERIIVKKYANSGIKHTGTASSNITTKQCDVYGVGINHGIQCVDGKLHAINDCYVQEATEFGINMHRVIEGVITNNRCYDTTKEGINLEDCTRVMISNNTVTFPSTNSHSVDFGISIYGTANSLSAQNLIVGNMVKGSGKSGIALAENVQFTNVTGNNILSPNILGEPHGAGILLYGAGCKDNIISNNLITNGKYGIAEYNDGITGQPDANHFSNNLLKFASVKDIKILGFGTTAADNKDNNGMLYNVERSPNGTRYKTGVNDAGVFTATQVL